MSDDAAAENQQPGKEVAVQDPLRSQMAKISPELKKLLPKGVEVERFGRVILNAIERNQDLLQADRRSLWAACMELADHGLMPDGREAALVTFFDKRRGRLMVQGMPMIGGILKKLRNSGNLASIDSQVAYKGEHFRVVLGDDPRIEHERGLDLPDNPEFLAVYAIAVTKEGTKMREVMSKKDVEKVRAASRSPDRGPWSSWFNEMARKTVIRRLAKRLETSSEDKDVVKVIEAVDAQYDFDKGDIHRREEEAMAKAAAAAGLPPLTYVDAKDTTHPVADIDAWYGDWSRRIAMLVRQNKHDDLEAAWNRNREGTRAAMAYSTDAVLAIERDITEALRAAKDAAEPPAESTVIDHEPGPAEGAYQPAQEAMPAEDPPPPEPEPLQAPPEQPQEQPAPAEEKKPRKSLRAYITELEKALGQVGDLPQLTALIDNPEYRKVREHLRKSEPNTEALAVSQRIEATFKALWYNLTATEKA